MTRLARAHGTPLWLALYGLGLLFYALFARRHADGRGRCTGGRGERVGVGRPVRYSGSVALSRLGVVAVLLALAVTGLAQGLDVTLDRYRRAEALGELSAVRGRAFEERRRPSTPDLPFAGTAVSLLPHSEAWLLGLDAIKRGARESMNAYRDAATAVRRSRDAYEKSLWQAGGGDLSQTATADREGGFTLDSVPAGPWILFASRSTYISRTPQERPGPGPGAPPRPPVLPGPFLPFDKLAGYHVVTYWVRTLTLAPGVPEAVELTDRNVWFTGVIESREPARLPDQPYIPPK